MSAEPPGVLIERSEQLDVLSRRLAEVIEQREGALLFVGGEAGAGKTSLIHEFSARSNTPVVVGGSEALRTPRAHGPLLDLAAELGGELSLLVEQGASPGDLVNALAEVVTRPTVLVFEDLHWADEATLDLLRVLARRLRRLPALVVATYRDDELSRTHPLRVLLGELATERRVTRLTLPLLSADGVALLAGDRLADVERLHRLTGGNPFFVTEVLAAESDGAPDTVRDAVLARAARLPPRTRRLLEAVAVVPSRAELWLLDAIAPLSLTGLEACVASGMLLADRETVQFRHEIARAAIEESLPPDVALSLHRRALAALVERGDAIDPARVAHHAAAVGDGRSVLAYAPAAADRAARLRAHREAAAHLASALRYVAELPRSRRVDLLERHAYECYLTSQPELAADSQRKALAEHEAAGDRLRQGDSHRWLSRLAWFSGDGATAQTEARLAIELLEPLGATTQLAMAFSNQSQLFMLADDHAGAREWGGRAIRLAEQLDDQEILAHALNNTGTAEVLSGVAEGRATLERSLRIAESHGLEEHVARALTNLASTAIGMHDLDSGLRWADQGIGFCSEHDLDSWRLYLTGWRARAHLERGEYELAARDASTALAAPSLVPTRLNSLVVLGRIRGRRGDGDPWPLLDEALVAASKTDELQRLVPVAAARAEVRLLEGSPELVAAETDQTLAGALARWPVLSTGELLVLRRRAGITDPPYDGTLPEPWALELAGRHRDASEAWGELGFPYERAQAMVAGHDDDLARAGLVALQDLGAPAAAAAAARHLRERGLQRLSRGPRAATARTPYGLTPRQLEVLVLLVAGLRNSEIAATMVLSERTVDHHVSAVLSKLGVETRAQAAHLATREGIVVDGGEPVPPA
jgi:DNA-binding CsgD family transcriptional regulator